MFSKNELREEKLALQREDGARVERASFIPPHPAAYQPDGHVPMWQYLQPSLRDTSQDHKLCCLRILQDNPREYQSQDFQSLWTGQDRNMNDMGGCFNLPHFA
ncbi:hypothetical protein KY289_019905 [Solanum tuberosum]|nr:hypothetical protein KY289_019905 [Solanum tuberosum]